MPDIVEVDYSHCEHILVVDDEPDVESLMLSKFRKSIRKNIYQFYFARNGIEAIKVIQEHPEINIVLTDLNMPEMDGLALLDHINKHFKYLTSVVISAYNDMNRIRIAMNSGGFDFLTKPIDLNDLEITIMKTVKHVLHEKACKQNEIAKQEAEKLALKNMVIAEKALEHSRYKSAFLANVSHEIKTPLTSIIGYAEANLGGDDLKSFKESNQVIIRNSQHLLEIVNDILDISKIEANRIQIERLPFSIFEIMQDIQLLMGDHQKIQVIDFQINYHYPLPKIINSDPTRFKQILLNLINNAIKFTEQGSVVVDIFYLTDLEQLNVKITDTGIGLTEQQQSIIFDAFVQAESNVTRYYGGTGLGLHISKQLAIKLGGDILVESEYGKGCCFIFSLYSPATQFVNAMPIICHNENQALSDNKSPFKVQGHILLAEDSIDNQNLLKLIIEETGARLTIVNNGRDAVIKALAQSYDLIIMDMQMPIMSGLDAVVELRNQGYQKPIVSLSAQSNVKSMNVFSNFDDNLTKPFNFKILYQCIGRYLTITDESQANNKMSQDFEKITEEFANRLPNYYIEILTYFNEENIEMLKNKIHQLKGAASMFKFKKIYRNVMLMEKQVIENDLIEARRTLALLMAEHKT